MLIDLIVAVLLVIAIFKGLRKGLILGIFSFLAFIVGLAAAIKLSALVAVYLSGNVAISQRWLPIIAFTIVFFLVVFLVRIAAKGIEGVLRIAMLGWLNRLGGVLLFALLYLFILSILLFYTQQLHLINPATIQASVTYPYLLPLGPKVIGMLNTILPLFKDMFSDLTNFFDGIAKKA